MTENTFRITSPCHPDYGICVETEYQGYGYMQERTPSGFYCDAPGCYNEWDIRGNPI